MEQAKPSSPTREINSATSTPFPYSQWIREVACGGDTSLESQWRALITDSTLWLPSGNITVPTPTWEQLSAISGIRGQVRNLYSQGLPFTLLSKYMLGYTNPQPATGAISSWSRSDRRTHPATIVNRATWNSATSIVNISPASGSPFINTTPFNTALREFRVSMTIRPLQVQIDERVLFEAVGSDAAANMDIRFRITQSGNTFIAREEQFALGGIAAAQSPIATVQAQTGTLPLGTNWLTLTAGRSSGATFLETAVGPSATTPTPASGPGGYAGNVSSWSMPCTSSYSPWNMDIRAVSVVAGTDIPSNFTMNLHNEYGLA